MKLYQRAIPVIQKTWRSHTRSLGRAIWRGTLILVVAGSAGCGLLEGLGPAQEDDMATAVAQTVTAQAIPSATALPGSPTPEPTFTSTQEGAVPATNTLEPTLAVVASLTPVPFTPVFPTLYPTPTSAKCCTLRVWNRNQRITYWIGTALPYGGNYIEPNHYVEFYLSGEKWMRIYWCRRVDFNNWTPDSIDDFQDHWRNELRFACDRQDVHVDQPVKEIMVQ